MEYAEGEFCDDTQGCRRRALEVIRDRDETIIDLDRRLRVFEDIEARIEGTEPDGPARHG